MEFQVRCFSIHTWLFIAGLLNWSETAKSSHATIFHAVTGDFTQDFFNLLATDSFLFVFLQYNISFQVVETSTRTGSFASAKIVTLSCFLALIFSPPTYSAFHPSRYVLIPANSISGSFSHFSVIRNPTISVLILFSSIKLTSLASKWRTLLLASSSSFLISLISFSAAERFYL